MIEDDAAQAASFFFGGSDAAAGGRASGEGPLMSKAIDENQVRKISHLARLRLTDEEVACFGAQLGSILGYVEQLRELDLEGVEPTAHPLPIVNVFRDDAPAASLGVDKALANAPAAAPPFFKVPKVLGQDSA